MNTKKDTVKILSMQLMRIINKHSYLEEQPIRFNETVILTPREIHSIQMIGEHDEINIKELGEFFSVSKSAASQMVAKLVKKGYVKKANPIHNNKELQLSLTELGWQAFRAHEQFHGKHMTELKQYLNLEFTDSDIAKTTDLLSIIETILDKRISELAPTK